MNAGFIRRHFFWEGRLRPHQAMWIVQAAIKILKSEPNVLSVTSPVTSKFHISNISFILITLIVCGNLHGQYVSAKVVTLEQS